MDDIDDMFLSRVGAGFGQYPPTKNQKGGCEAKQPGSRPSRVIFTAGFAAPPERRAGGAAAAATEGGDATRRPRWRFRRRRYGRRRARWTGVANRRRDLDVC